MAQEALEALQLEKRLSLLSHSGRPGSGGRAGTRLRWREVWRPWGWGRSFKPLSPPRPPRAPTPPHAPHLYPLGPAAPAFQPWVDYLFSKTQFSLPTVRQG